MADRSIIFYDSPHPDRRLEVIRWDSVDGRRGVLFYALRVDASDVWPPMSELPFRNVSATTARRVAFELGLEFEEYPSDELVGVSLSRPQADALYGIATRALFHPESPEWAPGARQAIVEGREAIYPATTPYHERQQARRLLEDETAAELAAELDELGVDEIVRGD